MSVGLVDNVGISLKFAYENTVKKILRWIVYFIVAVVFAIVIGIFSVIPVIGAILILLFGPFIGIFVAQYFNNLFE